MPRLRSAFAAGVAVSIVGTVVAALPSAAVVVAAPACDLPGKTCQGSLVHALLADGGDPHVTGPAEATCTGCIQSNCCDLVGACQEDSECIASFKDAHRCVIENGPGEESTCTTNLVPRARALYGCMRERCGGPTCRVPNCDVDPAAVLVVTPECDRCVTGACCEQINSCYADRRCKLIIECITNDCAPTLAQSMTVLGSLSAEARETVRKDVCAGRAPQGDPDRCLQQCLNAFAPGGEQGTADDQSARCLAFGVFTCSSGAQCGKKCALPESHDAGDDAASSSQDGAVSDAPSD
jgi:hypothetical protein